MSDVITRDYKESAINGGKEKIRKRSAHGPPKKIKSTVLSEAEEEAIVAFRKLT